MALGFATALLLLVLGSVLEWRAREGELRETEGATLNHLGVETETAAEVEAAEARLAGTGLETTGVDDTTCCYATKVETWVTDPDGARWEWYVKTGDADQLAGTAAGDGTASDCCAPTGRVTTTHLCC